MYIPGTYNYIILYAFIHPRNRFQMWTILNVEGQNKFIHSHRIT